MRIAYTTQGEGMARMNISVPDDLKARMDAAAEAVNWSGVASRAFELELGEIAKRQKEKDMSAVIQRLRASKLEQEDVAYKDGYRDGKVFAENEADYSDLKKLYELTDQSDWPDICESAEDAAYSPAEAVHMWMVGEDTFDRSESAAFWERFCGGEYPEGEYLRGFVEGAADVLAQVEDEL